MEELRIEIWDLLFRADQPKSLLEISELTSQQVEEVRKAVDHEWFIVNQDMISIAQKTG